VDQSSERDRITEAAYRTLVATGGTSLSVNEVLRAAELSTRAFYRHFDSKDELLLALFRQDSDRVAARLRRAADTEPPPAALVAFLQAMLRITADPRRRQRVLVMSSEEIARAKGFTAERLPQFVTRFERRTGQRAAICDRELRGDYPFAPDDA